MSLNVLPEAESVNGVALEIFADPPAIVKLKSSLSKFPLEVEVLKTSSSNVTSTDLLSAAITVLVNLGPALSYKFLVLFVDCDVLAAFPPPS